MLDSTLERIIQRFEEEYPETKLPALPSSPPLENVTSLGSSFADASILSASEGSNQLSKIASADEYLDETPNDGNDPDGHRLARTGSNASLAAKALHDEEGRMHRFGQSLRRDILKPTGTDDFSHGTSVNDPPESEHLIALRSKLENLTGEDIRSQVEAKGADSVVKEIGITLEELRALQRADPEEFQAFKESQLAAQMNTEIGRAS